MNSDQALLSLILAGFLFLALFIWCIILWSKGQKLTFKLQDLTAQALATRAENEKLNLQLTMREEQYAQVQASATTLEHKLTATQESERLMEKAQVTLHAQLQRKSEIASSLDQQLEHAHTHLDEQRERYEALRTKLEQAEREMEKAQVQLKNEKNYLTQLKEDFSLQKASLKDEFKALSEGILKERQKEFAQTNTEGLNAVLNPVREAFGSFKKRVEQVHTEHTKGQGQLENELKTLKHMNSQLSERAENLTSALRNDKKKLGNWGELQLERLLENSGLDRNCYRREANYKTDEGANQRPDFIIDLPEEKCLIIDSKVSLNAYIDSVNASNEEECLKYLKQHTTNIRNHIKALAEKSYDSLELLTSPDFVFMFMPNEAAYLAAFEEDSSLFDFAYDKKIAVITPNTLLPILRTVSSLWRVDKQNKSTVLLAASAEKVHKKLAIFLEKFERIGSQISTLQNSYGEAQKSLTGKASLVNLVQDFKEKGVKVSKEIPVHLRNLSE